MTVIANLLPAQVNFEQVTAGSATDRSPVRDDCK